jgi:ABC-type multidrug transport system permease subunit
MAHQNNIKNNQLFQLIRCRFLETLREPEVLFWGIVFPVLISIGLGLAFMQKNESKFNIMLVKNNQTELDSLLIIYGEKIEKNGKQIITWTVNDELLGKTKFSFIHSNWSDAIISLKRGESDVIITDSLAKIHYHFDPRNEQAELAYMKLTDLLKSPSNEKTTQQQISPLTLKGVRYIDFFIPGLIAFGLMASILWGISYTIIECRSQKLLRRMIATPMKKHNFLIAIIFVRTVMNFIEAIIIFFFAWLLFGIHIQGNISALFVLFIAGNIAFAGIAVLLSCRTSKTEAGSGLINAVQMPMMILSGIFFSYHNFPEWSIGAIKLLPLTALADGMRSIFNEGAGWIEIATPAISLSVFGIICFSVGMKLFKWQ